MLVLFTGALFLIFCGAIFLQFILKMRSLRSAETRSASFLTADRYRPMLRLLSNDDLAFVSAERKTRKAFRARRRELFRGYLRYLTRDYAHLLADVRWAMVQSGADRPDLAKAMAKNRVLFAVATCKIEFSLASARGRSWEGGYFRVGRSSGNFARPGQRAFRILFF